MMQYWKKDAVRTVTIARPFTAQRSGILHSLIGGPHSCISHVALSINAQTRPFDSLIRRWALSACIPGRQLPNQPETPDEQVQNNPDSTRSTGPPIEHCRIYTSKDRGKTQDKIHHFYSIKSIIQSKNHQLYDNGYKNRKNNKNILFIG
jgi:hypothetical protein